MYKSASENYTGIKDNNSLLNHIESRIKGYKEIQLNLNDFISYLDLEMILNNSIIEYMDFELYNFEALLDMEETSLILSLEADLKKYINTNEVDYDLSYFLEYNGYNEVDLKMELDYYDLSETKELIEVFIDNHLDELRDQSYDLCIDEVYQYFIIPNSEVEYWKNYTSYPIYYNEDCDLYLIGITHYGMSWKYFNTTYIYKEYI